MLTNIRGKMRHFNFHFLPMITEGGWMITERGWTITEGGWMITVGGWTITEGGWIIFHFSIAIVYFVYC